MEVSTMASVMDLSREGHLAAVFQMISFLKSEHDWVALFDPLKSEIDQTDFLTERWSTTSYDPCKEDTPSNASVRRCMGFNVRAFVDSDHSSDWVSRLSKTDFSVLLKSAPIFV